MKLSDAREHKSLLFRIMPKNPAFGRTAGCLLFLLSLARTRTIVYGFAAASAGTFLIAGNTTTPDFLVATKLVGSVYCIALATYIYNDLTDYKIDASNNRKYGHSSKDTYNKTLYATIGLFSTGLVLAYSINPATTVLAVFFTALAVSYSHPRIHLKDRFVIKTTVTAIGGLIASLMGSFATDNFNSLVLLASTIVFLVYFINGPLNDIRDLKGDKEGGRRTIPIVLGISKSFLLIYSILGLMGLILTVSYVLFDLHILGLAIGLSYVGYVGVKIASLTKSYQDKAKMNKTRAIVRNSIFASHLSLYLGLLLPNMLSL